MNIYLPILSHKDCPEVPYITAVLPGIESVKINWSGGYNGCITQTYIIEYKQESHEQWLDIINITDTNKNSYTAVINNLLPNEVYDVRMYAVNSINRSQFTNVFNVTTGGEICFKLMFILNIILCEA